MAAVAFALCGAGFDLVHEVLDAAAVPADGPAVQASAVSIGARHAGLVLGLVAHRARAVVQPGGRHRPGDARRDPDDAGDRAVAARQAPGDVGVAHGDRGGPAWPGARPRRRVRRARRRGRQRDGPGPRRADGHRHRRRDPLVPPGVRRSPPRSPRWPPSRPLLVAARPPGRRRHAGTASGASRRSASARSGSPGSACSAPRCARRRPRRRRVRRRGPVHGATRPVPGRRARRHGAADRPVGAQRRGLRAGHDAASASCCRSTRTAATTTSRGTTRRPRRPLRVGAHRAIDDADDRDVDPRLRGRRSSRFAVDRAPIGWLVERLPL